nr:transposase [Paenibacillus piri]
MDEAVRLVKTYFEKKLKAVPGIIAGLHTFGSRLNFNPHVHMLVTMGGMKKNGEWKTYDNRAVKKEVEVKQKVEQKGNGYRVEKR